MKLTELQKQHKPTVDWLLNENFGGKTYLISYCLLQKAVKNLNKDIELINHNSMLDDTIKYIFYLMKDEEFKSFDFSFNEMKMTIKAKIKKPQLVRG